jgi:formylglycine-generating enzyme required for sulfatase activity
MSETQEPEQPKKTRNIPGQPLPRLWKTEPEPDEEDEETGSDGIPKNVLKDDDPAGSQPPGKAKARSGKSSKPKSTKKSARDGGKIEKKVLLEETPAFDTIESRQRARLIMGVLSVVCVLLMVWITYRVFLYDPSEITVSAQELPVSQESPEIRPSLDFEARYIYDRAHDYAKKGQTDQAVGMLKRVVGVYKGTPTAAEAREALDRPPHNLPLFPEGPAILAERTPAEARHSPFGEGRGEGDRAAPYGPSGHLPLQVGKASTAVPGPIAAVPAPPPPGPGQVALIVPASPTNPAARPSTVENADPARATITPRALAPRALPPGFKPRWEAGLHESGWPLVIVGERDNAPMVLVPGGTFTMGSDRGESADGPAHTVRMSTYYIDQHEVTNRQFRTFLNEAQWHGQPPGKWLTDEKLRAQAESAPAVFVDYHDAESFAQWAHKRLPTEAQWEMAARSTDGRRYPWGDQPAHWSRPRAFQQVDPVMSFSEDVSAYGAFDMGGNVMEWVRDWYDARYFDKMRDKVSENPTGPGRGFRSIQRVVKGGSKNWTVCSRQGLDLDKRLPYLGFRCVLAVEGPEASAVITPHPAKPAGAQPGTNPADGKPPGGEVPF